MSSDSNTPLVPGATGRSPSPAHGVIVYLSFDGILQPLGYSQVFRIVSSLASEGLQYEILSLERDADLSDYARVEEIDQALSDAGVRWHRLAYHSSGGVRSAAVNLARAGAALAARMARSDVSLVHARGYHAAMVALSLQRAFGVPYLFDARGYWIDERLDEGRWFTNSAALSLARRTEVQLYARAAGIVTLTDLHAEEVRSSSALQPRGLQARNVVTIPTCADYDAFTTSQRRNRSELVLGLVGSINASYHTVEAIRLCAMVLQLAPNARLMIVTQQTEAFHRLLTEYAVPMDRVAVTSAPQQAMPQRLSCIDWGVMLLSESRAKRASMPTKLGEFFAAGVRPLVYGCNSEVARWVQYAGSGYIMDSLSEESLEAAARHVASSGPASAQVLESARAATAPHFSLSSGVGRYAKLIRGILHNTKRRPSCRYGRAASE